MKTFARVLTLALVLAGSMTVGSAVVKNCCTNPVCPPNCDTTKVVVGF